MDATERADAPAPAQAPWRGWNLPALSAARAFTIACAFAGLACWAVWTIVSDSHRDEAGALSAATARVAADVVDDHLAERTADLLMYRSITEESALWRQPELLRQRLERVQATRPGYSWLGLADARGTIVTAAGGLAVGKDVSGRDWFRGGMKDLFHGDVHEALLLARALQPLPGGEPWRFVDIAAPVRDERGRPQGVLAVHLSWPWLRERLRTAAGTLPAQASLWLVGHDDVPRLGPGAEPRPLKLESIRRARAGQSGWLVEQWPDGSRYITGYAPHGGAGDFKGFGWVTLVRTPLDPLGGPAAETLQAFLAAAAASVLMMTVLAWLVASRWQRPLRAFIGQVARLREGETPPRLPARFPRELHLINDGIARLVGRLDDKERVVRRALQDMEHSFRSVGRHLPGVLATVRLQDGEVSFSYVSDTAAHYWGVEPQRVLRDRHAWALRGDANDVTALRAAFQGVRDGDDWVVSLPVRFTGDDGRVRTLHNHIVRRDAGTDRTFDWIALDVTGEVEARAEAERASRAKSDFLATMSHELRTPLNAIMGFSRVLEETIPDREHRRQARFVRETSQVLARILNDVLDLAKVDAGRFALDPRPFALEPILDSVRALYRVTALEKGLELRIEAPRDLPTLVGDPVRLRQVLENLLSNAFKFTAAGGVQLSARLELTEDDLAEAPRMALLTLEVVDTGIGMTDEQLTRVWGRFEQGDRGIKIRHGGAGLGLAVVKTLVDKMGGSIRVQSQPGTGTAFAIALALPLARTVEPVREPVLLARQEPPLVVLVADDLGLNRVVIRAQLEARGHRVIEAVDGVQALQRAREQRPDLVLMDLDMPSMDGLEACRRLRALEAGEADGRRVPVWALTGKAFAEDARDCLDAGMDGHLAKPLSLEALVDVLQRVADARPAHAAPRLTPPPATAM